MLGNLGRLMDPRPVSKFDFFPVHFDGTNDFLLKTGGFDGAADGSTGLISFWCYPSENDAYIYQDLDGKVSISYAATGQFAFLFSDSAGTASFSMQTVGGYPVENWYHVLAAWNTNFSIGNKVAKIRVNDTSTVAVADPSGPFNINYASGANIRIGGPLSSRYEGCLAQLWFGQNQYLDIDVESNRRKFISAAYKPVYLGESGELPIGVAPILYLNSFPESYGINSGIGGNLDINGTFAHCGEAPPLALPPSGGGDEG